MPMTVSLSHFTLAATLAACALAACVIEPDPVQVSRTPGPPAGLEPVQPAGAFAPLAATPYDVTMTSQPGGQGTLVYAVRGYKDPRRLAGTVVVTFGSGSEIRYFYEVVGSVQRIRKGEFVFTQELGQRGKDPFGDHVMGVAMAVHRYFRWFEAAADAERLYGAGDHVAVARHMNVALNRDSSAVGYCRAEVSIAPVYGVTQETCEPERPTAPDVIDDCYGVDYGQDFECSAGAPEEVFFWDQRIDTRSCCLEHDRAFWCGGTRMDGTVPLGDAGSFWAWEAANAELLGCQVRLMNEAFVRQLGSSPWWADIFVINSYRFFVAFWTLYWAMPGFPAMWFESGAGFFNQVRGLDESDASWNARVAERERIVAERQSSCLCGGDREVPLCGQGCRLNDCSLPVPQVLEAAAFVRNEDACPTGECLWVCEEKTEDGEPISRRLRTYWLEPSGEGRFIDCAPEYDFTCECDPLDIAQALPICEVHLADLDDVEHAVSLPGDGDPSNGELIPLPPDARFAPPPIRKPPYIAP